MIEINEKIHGDNAKNIKYAIDTLCEALRTDPGYREGWIANIAMSMHDEWYSTFVHRDTNVDGQKLHTMFNKGAERFIDLLTSQNTEQ